jgi:hypothetical protein
LQKAALGGIRMATGRLAGSQSGPSMAIIAIVAIAVILVNS